MNWDFSTLADDVQDAIATAEAELRLEQAVYGLDSRDEKQIQALLAERLASRYQVAREVHYPSSKGRKLTHRLRCDLVLTPLGKPLEPEVIPERTLFDAMEPPVQYASSGEALWLEVKVAYQFREGGARHGAYTSQWRQKVVDDLRKMEAEPLIKHAGLMLIVFNESQEVLGKDLELFEDVLAIKEVLAGFRQVRSIPIVERIGHRLCTVAVWPTVQR